MSDKITDIEEWKQKYPFLEKYWDMYKQFDEPVDGDKYESYFHILCDQIITQCNGGLPIHKDICMKLMRNLGVYYVDAKIYELNHDRCKFIYNWIYNLMNKNKITYNVINKCFEMYKTHMDGIRNDNRCYNFSSYNIYEPIKITLLDIFDNYTPIIKEKLMIQDESISTPYRKYICECVKIYDDMHQDYCLGEKAGYEKHKNTCSRLRSFKSTYTWFFGYNQDLKDIIPSLDDIKSTYMSKCQKYVQEKPVQTSDAEERHTHPPLTKPEDENPQEAKSLITPGDENKGNHMSSTVSTTIGTVAGASSILALLYKFSPGGNWIRPGIRGSRGRISNNLYADQPNELFYDGFEGEVMNSYNPAYNVGYGSV